jgi:hypothetical protein
MPHADSSPIAGEFLTTNDVVRSFARRINWVVMMTDKASAADVAAHLGGKVTESGSGLFEVL